MSLSKIQANQMLLNMMRLSEKLHRDYSSYETMVNDIHFVNRSHSIEWMKKVSDTYVFESFDSLLMS